MNQKIKRSRENLTRETKTEMRKWNTRWRYP